MHGEGVFKLIDGDSYDENFLEGLREGFGMYSSKSGEKYVEDWVKGNRHGYGGFMCQ